MTLMYWTLALKHGLDPDGLQPGLQGLDHGLLEGLHRGLNHGLDSHKLAGLDHDHDSLNGLPDLVLPWSHSP